MELVQQGGVEEFRDAGGAGCTVLLDAVDSSQTRPIVVPLNTAPLAASVNATSTVAVSAAPVSTQGLPTAAAATFIAAKNDVGLTVLGAGGGVDGAQGPTMAVDRSTPFLYTVRMDRNNSAKRLHGVQGTYFDMGLLRRDFVQALHLAEMLPLSVEATDDRFAMGYIRPGHGAKGQKVGLVDERDLANMYEVCRVRHDVMLWYSVSKDVERPKGMYLPRGKGRMASPTTSPTLRQRKRAKVDSSPKADGVVVTSATLTPSAGISHVEVELLPQGSTATVLNQTWTPSGVTDIINRLGESPTSAVVSTTRPTPTAAIATGNASSVLSLTVERANARKTLIEQLRMWFELYNAGAVQIADYECHRQKILQDMERL